MGLGLSLSSAMGATNEDKREEKGRKKLRVPAVPGIFVMALKLNGSASVDVRSSVDSTRDKPQHVSQSVSP